VRVQVLDDTFVVGEQAVRVRHRTSMAETQSAVTAFRGTAPFVVYA
jgi:hypothetical protein